MHQHERSTEKDVKSLILCIRLCPAGLSWNIENEHREREDSNNNYSK